MRIAQRVFDQNRTFLTFQLIRVGRVTVLARNKACPAIGRYPSEFVSGFRRIFSSFQHFFSFFRHSKQDNHYQTLKPFRLEEYKSTMKN